MRAQIVSLCLLLVTTARALGPVSINTGQYELTIQQEERALLQIDDATGAILGNCALVAIFHALKNQYNQLNPKTTLCYNSSASRQHFKRFTKLCETIPGVNISQWLTDESLCKVINATQGNGVLAKKYGIVHKKKRLPALEKTLIIPELDYLSCKDQQQAHENYKAVIPQNMITQAIQAYTEGETIYVFVNLGSIEKRSQGHWVLAVIQKLDANKITITLFNSYPADVQKIDKKVAKYLESHKNSDPEDAYEIMIKKQKKERDVTQKKRYTVHQSRLATLLHNNGPQDITQAPWIAQLINFLDSFDAHEEEE